MSEQNTPIEHPVENGGDESILQGLKAFSARSFIRQIDWPLVRMNVAIKALLVVFGAICYKLFDNQKIDGWYGWLTMWHRWDSLRHLRIAQTGYVNVGPERTDLVGLPLYPWIVRAFAFIFQDYLISGFIVAGLASIAAGLLLYKLVRIDQPESVARNSVWFLLIFPTSYFLHINYTESLFLALALGCLLAARKENWIVAAILGLLVCMTRVNGLVIIPVLMVEAFQQYWETRRWQWEWLLIALAPLGFVVHLIINYRVAGDAFAFLTIGSVDYHKSLSTPWVGIQGVISWFWSDQPATVINSGVLELMFIAIGFVCIIACAWLLRPAYTAWIAGNWLMFTSVGYVLGSPRYTLMLFPIFILFAKLAERQTWFTIITVWSLLFLALFAAQFVRGHWAFG